MGGSPIEDVVLDHAVEALFVRALRDKMTVHCTQRLKEAGLDLSRKLRPTYPRGQFYRFLEIVREELFSLEDRDAALFRIGYGLLDGYEQTLLGRAVLGMVRLLGPRRTLARATQNLQSSNNYMESSLEELGPNRYALTLSQVSGAAAYFAGVIHRGLEVAGADGVEVRPQPGNEPGCVYLVRWKASS